LNQNVIVLLLDRLEDSGHVQRSRNPDNRREQFVRLSPKAKVVVRSVMAGPSQVSSSDSRPLNDDLIETIFDAAQLILSFESATKGRRGRSKVTVRKRAV